jgi:hypothetical protein
MGDDEMPHGVPTDETTLAKFRASYLYSGNAAESARQLGIPTRTGQQLAAQLSGESSFAEERAALRKRALEELVAMRMRVAQVAMSRLEEDLPIPDKVGDGASVNIVDRRQDYGKLILDAEKNAHNLARFDSERDGAVKVPGEVTVVLRPTARAAESDDGEAD